jgi:hypothetical protein
MWIVFGFSERKKDLGQHVRLCLHCQREAFHSIRQQQRWFTLFFVPIFPISGKEQIDRCQICGYESAHVDMPTLVAQAGAGGMAVLASRSCPRCGGEVDAAAERCPSCGNKLGPAEPPSQQDMLRAQASYLVQQTQRSELESRIRRFRIWGVILAVLGVAILLFPSCYLVGGGLNSAEDPGTTIAVLLLCFLLPALTMAGGGSFLLWKAVQLGKPSP